MAHSKTKILFLGSRPLGKRILEMLLNQDDVTVVGMASLPISANRYWKDDPSDID